MLAPEMAVYTEEDGMESAGPLTPVDGPVEYVRATALAEAQAHIARLEALLVAEREETLWNAYHTGHEKDGMWDHCCMSDGEWLARECGFNANDRCYPAGAIKAAIPVAARAALAQGKGDGV